MNYRTLIMSYGAYPALIALLVLEEEEEYEKCYGILSALKEIESEGISLLPQNWELSIRDTVNSILTSYENSNIPTRMLHKYSNDILSLIK